MPEQGMRVFCNAQPYSRDRQQTLLLCLLQQRGFKPEVRPLQIASSFFGHRD